MSSWARKWIRNDPFMALIWSEDLGNSSRLSFGVVAIVTYNAGLSFPLRAFKSFWEKIVLKNCKK